MFRDGNEEHPAKVSTFPLWWPRLDSNQQPKAYEAPCSFQLSYEATHTRAGKLPLPGSHSLIHRNSPSALKRAGVPGGEPLLIITIPVKN